MTIWSLTLVVLAGVSLAAGWRLHLNEPVLASIGLSAGALLLLIVSMFRDRSAKRKQAAGQPSSPAGRPEGNLSVSAAGYGGAGAFRSPLLPEARSDGHLGSYPFAERYPAVEPYPAGAPVTPLDFERDRDLGELRDLEWGRVGSESLEAPVEPEATVQILPPEAGEPPAPDAPAGAEDVTAAGTEAFRIESIDPTEDDPAPAPPRPEEVARDPSEPQDGAPRDPENDAVLNGLNGAPGAPGAPAQDWTASEAWGFGYPSFSPSPHQELAEPGAGFADPEAQGSTHETPGNAPEGQGRSAAPGGRRRPEPRRPSPPKKDTPSRPKTSGKLVYWWETDQGSAGAARKRGAAEGSPAPAGARRPDEDYPEDSPDPTRPDPRVPEDSPDPTRPDPRVPEDVSATPAERAKPPEITIRLVPAPKRRAKPPAGKRPRTQPATETAASMPQIASELASPPPVPSAIREDVEGDAPGATPPANVPPPGAAGKPVAARTRPTIGARPAMKLRSPSRAVSTGRRAATGSRPAPQQPPTPPAGAAPGSGAADSPSEEKPFKYLD